MDLIEGSETSSANINQTLGIHPKIETVKDTDVNMNFGLQQQCPSNMYVSVCKRTGTDKYLAERKLCTENQHGTWKSN
jgi:hypothetical protein